jgi:hypothetical protein
MRRYRDRGVPGKGGHAARWIQEGGTVDISNTPKSFPTMRLRSSRT